LHHLYPKADIPVFQLSIDYAQAGVYHLAVGQALSALRDHYAPLLYALGAARDGEAPRFVYEGFQLGTLSMRCVQWG
jgi:4,5-DOPA dioxygenase extradiol